MGGGASSNAYVVQDAAEPTFTLEPNSVLNCTVNGKPVAITVDASGWPTATKRGDLGGAGVVPRRGTKSLKQWTEQEVTGILKIFIDFDHDKSGSIDHSELKNLAAVLMLEDDMEMPEKMKNDEHVDEKEFFAW